MQVILIKTYYSSYDLLLSEWFGEVYRRVSERRASVARRGTQHEHVSSGKTTDGRRGGGGAGAAADLSLLSTRSFGCAASGIK